MRRSSPQQIVYLVSILFAATPFAFALIRAIRTGHDLRYLWPALASFLGASAVMVVGMARSRTPRAMLALSAMALVVATLLAGGAASLLGGTSGPAVWVVALGFGLCSAAGSVLAALSREPETRR